MKNQVSTKLLVLFSLVCGIFFFAESGFCATVANKSSTFSTQLSKSSDNDAASDSALAEQIRAQRAARDARDNQTSVSTKTKSGSSKNSCDTTLRKCIESKCGANYRICETDSDTTFSDKLTACKKDANCTAHEFSLFTNEIKEDKKQAIRLALYNQVIDCGNKYNDCIITECGKTFNKCLGKTAGDKAIAKCKSIATECTEADSGLAGRIGSVFGTVRQDAEVQVKADEKKLSSLRDQMRNSCKTLGALFDDRSLDCVFSVSFSSGSDDSKINASKKLYAGSIFDCTPDWFGIDVTTFKENAYRATRAQTAASSAMLGSGIGTAVGALTSGALDRAIDSQKAENALEQACGENGQKVKDGKCVDMTPQEKCEASDGDWKNQHCVCDDDKKEQDGICVDKTAQELCKDSGGEPQDDHSCKCKDANKKDVDGVCIDKKTKELCDQNNGKMNLLGKCECKTKIEGFDGKENGKLTDGPCKANDNLIEKATSTCKDSGGTWGNNECTCPEGKRANSNYKCVDTFGTTVGKIGSGIGNVAGKVGGAVAGIFSKKDSDKQEETKSSNEDSGKPEKTKTKPTSETHSNSATVTKPSKIQRRQQDIQEAENRAAADQQVTNAMNSILNRGNEFK